MPRGANFHFHVGEHEANGLMIDQGLAHALAFARVGKRRISGGAGDAEGLRGNGGAGVVQRHHGNAKSITGLAEDLISRDANIV